MATDIELSVIPRTRAYRRPEKDEYLKLLAERINLITGWEIHTLLNADEDGDGTVYLEPFASTPVMVRLFMARDRIQVQLVRVEQDGDEGDEFFRRTIQWVGDLWLCKRREVDSPAPPDSLPLVLPENPGFPRLSAASLDEDLDRNASAVLEMLTLTGREIDERCQTALSLPLDSFVLLSPENESLVSLQGTYLEVGNGRQQYTPSRYGKPENWPSGSRTGMWIFNGEEVVGFNLSPEYRWDPFYYDKGVRVSGRGNARSGVQRLSVIYTLNMENVTGNWALPSLFPQTKVAATHLSHSTLVDYAALILCLGDTHFQVEGDMVPVTDQAEIRRALGKDLLDSGIQDRLVGVESAPTMSYEEVTLAFLEAELSPETVLWCPAVLDVNCVRTRKFHEAWDMVLRTEGGQRDRAVAVMARTWTDLHTWAREHATDYWPKEDRRRLENVWDRATSGSTEEERETALDAFQKMALKLIPERADLSKKLNQGELNAQRQLMLTERSWNGASLDLRSLLDVNAQAALPAAFEAEQAPVVEPEEFREPEDEKIEQVEEKRRWWRGRK